MIRLFVSAVKHTFSYPQIAVWTLIALGATVMGPFGTYTSLDWLPRAAYWFTICGGSVFLACMIRATVSHFIRDQFSFGFLAVHICTMTAVFAPFVYGLTRFIPREPGVASPSIWLIALFVFLIGVLIHTIGAINRFHQLVETCEDESGSIFMPTDARTDAASGEPARPAADPLQDCRLRHRLPPGLREPILHLSARDHFVDVETATSLYSLRMRFADAVAEMDGIDGHATHRSHWVATAAIREPLRDGGKQFLVLSNGTLVPVSRGYRDQLADAGLI